MNKPFSKLDVRTWIEIDSRSLFSNLHVFEKYARPSAIMAVVKSNAYGHGLSLVASLLAENHKSKILNQKSSLWFGVDSIVEALRLRKDGIKSPILVLGYTLPVRFSDAARHDITIAISHLDGLRSLAHTLKKPAFHLKFDTGMHRHGFEENEIGELIEKIKAYRLKPAGAFSHLAAADNRAFSKKQIESFDRSVKALEQAGIKPDVIHFNKSEGIVKYPRHDALMRLGIGLYGYLPGRARQHIPLMPVLSWKTVVTEVKAIKKGDSIGYDLTYRFPRNAKVAILPVGYWHGYDRGFSNNAEVLIHGKRASVRGRICMDITMVEVTGILGVRVGDEVVLIGHQGRERIIADELARRIGTTSYEVLTRLNPLIRRIAV